MHGEEQPGGETGGIDGPGRAGGHDGAEGPDWRRQRRELRRMQIARRRRRLAALASIVAVVVVVAIAFAVSSGSGPSAAREGAGAHSGGSAHQGAAAHHGRARGRGGGRASSEHGSAHGETPVDTAASRLPRPSRSVSAPILMYHVINPPPAGAPFPGLYVPKPELVEQLQALAKAGYDAVTLEQLWSHWHDGTPLPKGKPIVLSFDNGYQSQFTNALPVLNRLGWHGVENIQLTGLPPSQGGLSDEQVKGLVAAGWELDTQGISHAELPALDAEELRYQVATARREVAKRYDVPVNWFCYPSGHYNATVIAAVQAAGYRGATTVVPGWAARAGDPYRLPRLRVLGGTNGSELVALIEATEHDAAPPTSYE